jgi:catechol 2,3-dioxygenase-like lactoylglutathione lyase family enzyme
MEMIQPEHKHMQLLQGIDTVIVRVSNIEISKDWYVNKLGLTATWDDPQMKLVVLDTKSATSLTLWQTNQKLDINRDTASYPIFRTQDADALKQELERRGIEVSEVIEDEHVKYFFFFDPDGNVLEACQVQE